MGPERTIAGMVVYYVAVWGGIAHMFHGPYMRVSEVHSRPRSGGVTSSSRCWIEATISIVLKPNQK